MVDTKSVIPKLTLHTGRTIPMIGYGTYQLRGTDCVFGVKTAIMAGYTHIDTASIYRNETSIAEALNELYKGGVIKRSDLFITSKIAPGQQGYDNTINACKDILKLLQTDYLDLLIIHWPGVAGYKPEAPENAKIRLETWKALEKLKEAGLVKDIGVSNFMKKHLEHLLNNTKTVPVINQFEIHPLCIDKPTIDFCRANKIVVEAYSSLARNSDELFKNELLLGLAKKYKKDISQIALRWGIQNNFVVLPKSKTESRIKQNINIFDFEINKEDMEKLNSMNKNYHTCWDPNTVLHQELS